MIFYINYLCIAIQFCSYYPLSAFCSPAVRRVWRLWTSGPGPCCFWAAPSWSIRKQLNELYYHNNDIMMLLYYSNLQFRSYNWVFYSFQKLSFSYILNFYFVINFVTLMHIKHLLLLARSEPLEVLDKRPRPLLVLDLHSPLTLVYKNVLNELYYKIINSLVVLLLFTIFLIGILFFINYSFCLFSVFMIFLYKLFMYCYQFCYYDPYLAPFAPRPFEGFGGFGQAAPAPVVFGQPPPGL